MKCPFCKKIYDEEYNFCPWCGSEKPEINYDDVESFEEENEILEEETIVFEKQFRNIEEELKILQDDIKNFEKWKNDNNEELEIVYSSIYDKGMDYDDEELETLYSDVFEREGYDFGVRAKKSSSEIRCHNCGSTKFLSDYDRGEIVCTRCGLLVSEHLLDMGATMDVYK